jgi:hypothetical protein
MPVEEKLGLMAHRMLNCLAVQGNRTETVRFAGFGPISNPNWHRPLVKRSGDSKYLNKLNRSTPVNVWKSNGKEGSTVAFQNVLLETHPVNFGLGLAHPG